MAFLRSPATATTTTAIAFAFSSSSSFKSPPTKPPNPFFSFLHNLFHFSPKIDCLLSRTSSSHLLLFTWTLLHLITNLPPRFIVLPELLIDVCSIEVNMSYFIGIVDVSNMFGVTEFMVDMKCEGCVNAVKNKLQAVDVSCYLHLFGGEYIRVKNVEVDLTNQVVRILGSSPVKTMTEALEQTGRKARLIGQGVPEEFLVPAAVGEFKGPDIFGVVRLAQVNMECARIEASFSGLSPGKHGWSVNEYGDLTKGAASTGKVYNPTTEGTAKEPLGDLGTLDVNDEGNATFSGVKEKLRVSDLIGRSIAVYGTEDKSDSGVTAAVIARSAGVGENHKKICLCDGTTIWESTNSDFVASKV
ncbi:hypothetical protein Pint_15972 [Pistacia integerrima]|uniref:Uncharacterized protein n=1 Tax=Pistacia integerrima TaxID=434235 RepID=A0ACC0ZFX0_9ROSI|nr:hypothetical protein Pint_15972 [Pistacia integerrima]